MSLTTTKNQDSTIDEREIDIPRYYKDLSIEQKTILKSKTLSIRLVSLFLALVWLLWARAYKLSVIYTLLLITAIIFTSVSVFMTFSWSTTVEYSDSMVLFVYGWRILTWMLVIWFHIYTFFKVTALGYDRSKGKLHNIISHPHPQSQI